MEWIPKVGMYVKFSREYCNSQVSLYGQIKCIGSNNILRVVLHDLTRSKQYEHMYGNSIELDYSLVAHIPAKLDAKVVYNGLNVRIVPSSDNLKQMDSMYVYCIEYYKNGIYYSEHVSEEHLSIHMTYGVPSPIEMLTKGEVYGSMWYMHRNLISEAQSSLRIAPDGFKSILGSRAMLFPHQIDAINCALSGEQCRFMLADEVGLGKTIEACSILKALKTKNRRLHTLIIVPDALRPQWIEELSSRFREKAVAMVPHMAVSALIKAETVIATFDTFEKCSEIIEQGNIKWDLCIVDEAHKLLRMPSLYKKVLGISIKTERVLILSATPVLKGGDEYHRLLTLLNPTYFGAMSNEQFSGLSAKQNSIRELMFSLESDLSEFVEYNLKSDYLDIISELHDLIADKTISEIIERIKSEDDLNICKQYIKGLVAYIAEFYQLDKYVIRHRKAELAESLATRELIDISYDPAGSAEGFYESDCIKAVSELFAIALSGNPNGKIVRMCKMLFQATTSSPYAVLGIVKNQATANNSIVDNYMSTVNAWKNAYDWEIDNIKELREHPERFHSKLSRILQWIDEEDPNSEKKFLIFSEYNRTAEQYFKAFKNYFGETTTLIFKQGLQGIEYNKISYEFQNKQDYRFLICDASGGVGRNFQAADYIVHCDLSWSPAIMEQRIGRLDRIGRNPEKKVVSVVVHSEYGVENDLFEIYDEGLKVFTKSLCGMEIAFDEIQETIDAAFVSDPEHGLQFILPQISEFANQIELAVEEEMYYLQSHQMDLTTSYQIEKLSNAFELNNTADLANAMCSWAKAIGFNSVSKTVSYYDKADTVKIDLGNMDRNKLVKYSYALPFDPTIPIITGTFNRAAAVAHEKLYFLAPSNALYESLTKNALSRSEGMSSLIYLTNTGVKWEGFTFCWNIHFDYKKMMDLGLPSESLAVLNKYLESSQIRVFVSMPELIVDEAEAIAGAFAANMTPGNIDNISSFKLDMLEIKSAYIADVDWKMCVEEAYRHGLNNATNRFQSMFNYKDAEEFLENRLIVIKAKQDDSDTYKLFSEYSNEKYKELFLYGIKNLILDLDSAAYVIME